MTTPIHLRAEYWALKVPSWANGFKIETIPQVDLYELTCYEIAEYNEPKREQGIDLPPGTWQFLFTTKEATWEQAEMVVAKFNGWYKDYGGGVYYSNPVDSLQSLLKAKGCDPSKNYAIISKPTNNAGRKTT